MKKGIQILLATVVLFPHLLSAREETLGERKQRIMRKYLREHTQVIQTDLMVPEDSGDADIILESERLKEIGEEFERHEINAIASSRTVKAPRRQQQLPKTEGRNWLLAEESSDEDPFAEQSDSFDVMDGDFLDQWDLAGDLDYKRSRRQDPYDEWMRQQEAYTTDRSSLSDRYEDAYGYGTRRDRRSVSDTSGLYRYQNDRLGTGSGDSLQTTTGFRSRSTSRSTGSTLFRSSRSQTGGSLFDRERSSYDSSSRTTYGAEARKQEQQPGLIRYPSRESTPSQSQELLRQNRSSLGQQKEYKRVNPYDKWKQKSSVPDPMADDSYVKPASP